MDRHDFDRQIAEAAREMSGEHGTIGTLDRAVQMATELVEHCDLAALSLVHSHGIDTPAASDESLRRVDELQYELREGPCLDALSQVEVMTVTNLADDSRWPRWGSQVARELGIHSSMSFRLFTTGENLGVLNLYATVIDAFTHDDLLDGLVVAAQAAVALAATLETDQLHTALATSRMIGEALGILRERFNLTSDQAFAALTRISQQYNIKLNQVARGLVETGCLPDHRT